jgi:hypothetical protein
MLSWLCYFFLWVGLGLMIGPSLLTLLGWSDWEPYIFRCFYIGIGSIVYPIGRGLNITQTLPILICMKRDKLHGTSYNIMDDIR